MQWRNPIDVLTCRRGHSATIFALCALPLMGAVAAAIELTDMAGSKNRLQAAADAGALAGAGRLSLASTTGEEDAKTVAVRAATENMNGDPASFSAVVDHSAGTLTVNATAEYQGVIGVLGKKTLHATAVAEALQKTPLCVLQIDSGAITLSQSARISAPGCMIHANQDIAVGTSALITAQRIQASGAVTGPTRPTGNGGALPIPDPFDGMKLDPDTACKVTVGVAAPIIGDYTLSPGVHCLPILAVGHARLKLQPGDHYFIGGLLMTQNSTIEGDDVALIFGPMQIFNFADKATVRLTARKSGPFAGFLIATTRANTSVFKISSGNASEMLGTIYIPNATLQVTSKGNVAQDSDWSIIVAKKIELKNSPNLVINTRYAGSGVPVPEGVGPRSATVLKQ